MLKLSEELLKQNTLQNHERKGQCKTVIPTIVSIDKLLCKIDDRVLIRKILLSRSKQISASIPDHSFL